MVLSAIGLPRRFYVKSGATYSPDPGDSSTLIRNADGSFLINRVDGTKYGFDPARRLKSITDRYGNTIAIDNSTPGIRTITDSAGHHSVVSYDTTNGLITSIKDPSNNIYDFSYNNGLLSQVAYPAPASGSARPTWSYLYNAVGLLEYKTDPEMHIVQYKYDTQGRVIRSVDPNGVSDTSGNVLETGHTKYLAYDTPTTGSTTFTEKDGGRWVYTFDQAKTITGITAPDGNTTSTYYNPNYTIKAMTEPFDGANHRLTTFYTYDGIGNMLTMTEPVDLSAYTQTINPATIDVTSLANLVPPIKTAFSYTYDLANNNRITSISDQRGATAIITTYTYSSQSGGDVVTAVTTPGNFTTVSKYNPDGTVREIIDANHDASANPNSTTLAYSSGGMLWRVKGLDGVTTTVTSYDSSGNPLELNVSDTADTVKVTSVLGRDYLARPVRLTRRTSLPDNITRFDYDKVGNVTTLTDAETRPTIYRYNYKNQITKITDANQNDTVLAYGGTGCASCGTGGGDKLTAVYDARFAKNTPLDSQPHTSFSYDMLGHKEFETDPLGKKIHYIYYDNGLLKSKADASASPEINLFTYYYNSRGQVRDRVYTSADSRTDHYEYNPNGTLSGASTTINGVAIVNYTYAYYDNGRLQSVTDSNGRTISYDLYDGIGQRKTVTFFTGTADQRVVNYDYDTANRPWHITSSAGTFTFGYDSLSRRNSLTYPNQVSATYGYDDLNRLISLNHQYQTTAIASYTYTHDQAGNRMTKAGTSNETYDYDELYRLLRAATANGTENYTYDAVGNRMTGPGAKDTGYLYNTGNQMTRGRQFSYSYDNNGNQTSRTVPGATDKSWSQTWDYENRLVKLEKIKGTERRTVTFKYDPFGKRIEKKLETVIDGVTKTSTWTYLYDNDNIALEIFTDAAGAVTKTFYTQGPGTDEHLAMERGGSFYYYHADGLGSVVSITNSAHNVVQSYQYDSFGMATPSTSFYNSYTYTAREWDKETGLYYYRARYYDPMEGRFISKDPISFAGGINVYAFVQNNPINLADPFGLRPLADTEKAYLSPYIPSRDLNNADVHVGEMPWYSPSWSAGITRGNDIYIRNPNQTFDTPAGLGLLGHELVHVGQYANGMTALSYLWANLWHGYDNNPYEVEAYKIGDQIVSDLRTKYGDRLPCKAN